jgi:hypothetical protein
VPGCHTLVFRLVEPVDDDMALRDAQRIEVLAHSECQLVLVYSSLCFGACHGRRHSPDALVEHDVTERVLEARGTVKAVGSSVALED